MRQYVKYQSRAVQHLRAITGQTSHHSEVDFVGLAWCKVSFLLSFRHVEGRSSMTSEFSWNVLREAAEINVGTS